jgi:hypothetical protein
MDLVPGIFPDVKILRHPGYNVAYWNLPHRTVETTPAGTTVNGASLRFFHFSGFDPECPEKLSKHEDRFGTHAPAAVAALCADFAAETLAAGHADCRHWPYAYGRFRNGVPIPDAGRGLPRELPGIEQHIPDPFSDAGFDAIRSIWTAPPSGAHLGSCVFQSRAELQAALSGVRTSDLPRYLEWLRSTGQSGRDLEPGFVAPAWDATLAGSPHIVRADEAADAARNGPALAPLALRIYQSRPDLKRAFPDPAGRDELEFLTWLLTSGRREFGLDDAVLKPLREQWRARLATLPTPLHRLWQSARLFLKRRLTRLAG